MQAFIHIFNRKLLGVLGAFTLLILFGMTGYILFEEWPWNEALYMTIITLSTVGYSEVEPLSTAGRTFSMILIVVGVGAAAYAFSIVTDYIVAGELRGALRRQRMLNKIAQLDDHFIICGYGRVGREVLEELRANRFEVVIIDVNPGHIEVLEEAHVCYIIGDAAEDDILTKAGIERAAGLCTCLPDDAANVFTILTARTLNEGLYIISRCNQQESERKLRIAGANQVINPYLITGHRMAAQLLHPGVVEFLDVIMRQGNLELRIEEIQIAPESPMAGRTLGDCHVRHETGVNVLAVRRADGALITTLNANFQLCQGDRLISLGTPEQLTALAGKAGEARKWLAA